MDVEFVILAGGLGKRLRERTGNLPKVLAEVDNRALLEHQLLLLRRAAWPCCRRSLCLLFYAAHHTRDPFAQWDGVGF